jgi:hypothetical protein
MMLVLIKLSRAVVPSEKLVLGYKESPVPERRGKFANSKAMFLMHRYRLHMNTLPFAKETLYFESACGKVFHHR